MTGPGAPEDQPEAAAAEPAITGGPWIRELSCSEHACAFNTPHICDALGCMFEQGKDRLVTAAMRRRAGEVPGRVKR